ncbi:MAG: glycogen debranching enzyme N-terminal domain-containing protein, partial [Polyangiaceae bacterium]|nr:glycogen debranching enzyme N-terminal domain-containing protein [Polyangiaceae bacterium]
MTDSVWPNIRVDGDLERARVEWIHGNGTGAYASSTVAQMHTRRHHGLLVAALEPPRRRCVIVSHVDASVEVDGQSTSLATHQFPGVRPTSGHTNLACFAQDPLPRWVYDVRGSKLEHTLALARGHNVLVLRYVWHGARPAQLTLRPLLAMRPFHCLVREHGAMIQRVEMRQHEVSVRPVPALPRLVFRHKGVFVGSPDWWRRFEYLAEQVRGLDFQED